MTSTSTPDGRDGPEGASAPARPARRPTMQDVADRVGMSRPLVSIVLRGAPGASEESRRRVLAAAREIGYHPDDSARMLRRRRSRMIGLMFTMRQPFEIDLVDALYAAAAERGYRLALSHIGPGRTQRTAMDELLGQRIEALIATAADGGAGTISDLPGTVPVVLLAGPGAAEGEDAAVLDEVRVENAAGVSTAVRHLVELGHEDIVFVGPTGGPNPTERRAGYETAMTAAGLGDRIRSLESPLDEIGGHAAASALLADPQRPTAVLCANDHCAFGLAETLLRAGLDIPGDVSVVGFDDSAVARLPFLDLTTLRPDPLQMARLAIEAADRRIAEPRRPAEHP
ncbi:MAG TPA: LacI family transcriptional regulator, partial [Candidatus Brachybacterium intestinipullorum]|nr:LacI family transcriptional regulator [Candidatus Brachybacterium intestinipullorum]